MERKGELIVFSKQKGRHSIPSSSCARGEVMAFLYPKTLSEEEKMRVSDITETEKVERWVEEQLLEAGCPGKWALEISGYGVDCHAAVEIWTRVARVHEVNRAGQLTARILRPTNPEPHQGAH